MGEKTKHIFIRLATWLMIAVFGLILVNNALYTHSHIKSDGTLVTHAHPFNKSNDSAPIKKHQHSHAYYLCAESIDILYLISFSFIFFHVIIRKRNLFYSKRRSYLIFWQQSPQGRAPPLL